MAVAVAVAVTVSGGGAVAVPVPGLTKRFFNHVQKDFLINVWSYESSSKIEFEAELCISSGAGHYQILIRKGCTKFLVRTSFRLVASYLCVRCIRLDSSQL